MIGKPLLGIIFEDARRASIDWLSADREATEVCVEGAVAAILLSTSPSLPYDPGLKLLRRLESAALADSIECRGEDDDLARKDGARMTK